jgi:Fic family protein
MNPDDFTSNAPGELVKNLHGAWSFVPHALPPRIEMDEELVSLLNLAERALGRLVGKAESLPDPRIAVRSFIRREAELSSRIENTFADFRALALFEQTRSVARQVPDVREVWNNERAISCGVEAVQQQGREVGAALIKELHGLLMEGVRGDELSPGEFRRIPVFIGKTERIEEARFVPPPPLMVPQLMDDLERFLKTPSGLPPLVRSAVVHYQFETIHPFADGNGRIGRAMILLLLCAEGVLPLPVFNPSLDLERNRAQYYQRLTDVSQRGDWLGWVKFYARCITAAATDAVAVLDRLRALQAEYYATLQRMRVSSVVLRLVDELFVDPVTTGARAARVLGVYAEAAQSNIDKLVRAGILREITGRRRGRVYFADRIAEAVVGKPLPPDRAPNPRKKAGGRRPPTAKSRGGRPQP